MEVLLGRTVDVGNLFATGCGLATATGAGAGINHRKNQLVCWLGGDGSAHATPEKATISAAARTEIRRYSFIRTSLLGQLSYESACQISVTISLCMVSFFLGYCVIIGAIGPKMANIRITSR